MAWVFHWSTENLNDILCAQATKSSNGGGTGQWTEGCRRMHPRLWQSSLKEEPLNVNTVFGNMDNLFHFLRFSYILKLCKLNEKIFFWKFYFTLFQISLLDLFIDPLIWWFFCLYVQASLLFFKSRYIYILLRAKLEFQQYNTET